MTSTISHRNNCFDFLRLLAASMVIFFHQNMFLGGGYVTDPSDWFPMDSVWVQVFISLSGYLVTMSFLRSESFLDFMKKRIRRLFPALIICNIVVLYLIAPFLQESIFSYIFSIDTIKSFFKMSILLSNGNDVPHLWTDYGWIPAANAPIWTLTHEFFLYILAGLAFSFTKSWKAPALLLLIFVILQVLFSAELSDVTFYSMNIKHFTELGNNFALGSLMYVTKESWDKRNVKITLSIICIVVMLSCIKEPNVSVAVRSAITALTIIIGVSFRDRILNGKFDISYGMYIWAFPFQAIAINILHLGFYYGLVAVFITTAIVACLSRKYVEEPFMRKI